jgi:ubiquinone/menaquinone biosynthesis C-methylase UbiE
MALSQGEAVVDLGCGAGGSAVCLATEYGAAVTAVDEAGACVQAARAAAEEADVSAGRALGIRVVHAAAAAAPLKPAYYDAALMRGLLGHTRSPKSVLQAAARAVRGGGVAVVVDRVEGPAAPAHEADCAAYASRGIHLHSVAALCALAGETGWKVRTVSTDATTSDVAESLKSCARLLHGKIKAAQALGDSAGTLAALRAELAAEGGRLEAGIIQYTMITLDRAELPEGTKQAPTSSPRAPTSSKGPVTTKTAEDSEGAFTVGGVVGAAAAVGILALGGWFVMNRTDVGSAIASAGRRAVKAVFPSQGASD